MTGTLVRNPFADKIDAERFTTLYSGTRFYYSNFRLRDIHIKDISNHLAAQNRWLGALHTDHYSTAEHSVHLANYILLNSHKLPAHADDIRRVALAFLLHDAEEFVTGDIASPFKALIPEVEPYANYVRQMIFKQFNVPYAYYALVKPFDMAIRVTEAEQWMNGGVLSCEFNVEDRLPVNLIGWSRWEADKQFLQLFMELF